MWKNELEKLLLRHFVAFLLLQVSNAAFIGPSVKADTDRWTWTSNISHIDSQCRSTDTNMQCVLYGGKTTRTTVSFGLLKWHWKGGQDHLLPNKKSCSRKFCFCLEGYLVFLESYWWYHCHSQVFRTCAINCIQTLANVS